MNVLLVTSWDTVCGIAQHSKLMKEGVEAADPCIRLFPYAEALDPTWVWEHLQHLTRPTPNESPCFFRGYDLVLFNYHAALHSRWTEEMMTAFRKEFPRLKVVIAYHDTFAGTPDQPNSDRAKALNQIADAFIVHEPVEDLPGAIHWRHGVPAIQAPTRLQPVRTVILPQGTRGEITWMELPTDRPLVGSAGFNFGWKNFDLLCEAAALAGWRVLLIGPNYTKKDAARWRQWQPDGIFYLEQFPSQAEVVAALSACDATCFLYNNANTGVSGAVRFGIAARKPCLLMDQSRQFRDIQVDPGLNQAFHWTKYHTETIAEDLAKLPSVKFDHRLCAIAERDSWTRVGQRYAALFRELVG